MKVLQLNTHMEIGGIPGYILNLSAAMAPIGVETVVASSGGAMARELERGGLRHIELDIKTKSELSPKVIRSIFAVRRIIKEEGIDIVHAHSRVAQTVAFFACRLANVPYVTTCHGYFRTRARKIFDTWGSRVIAISEAVREHLLKELGVKDDRICLVYSGIDSGKFSKTYRADEIGSARKYYGLRPGPVVGHIGRLSPVKGQKYLLQAMALVLKRYPEAQLFIIGNGPEEEALKRLAAELAIDGSVRFLDSDLDTCRLLSVMDVFAFPSVKEGLGIALLEAMASGKACIASRTGGINDIIQDGSTGSLFAVGDVAALADGIIGIIGDPELKERLGRSAEAAVREKFTLERWASQIKRVYEDVLK